MKTGGSTKYGHKYDFHFPYALYRDNEYEEGKEEAIQAVKDGMTTVDAITIAFQIHKSQAYKWIQFAEEDLEKGFTRQESRLINLILCLASAELGLKRRLERRANDLALDPEETNVEMLKFLLERRHGYVKQTQNDIEVGTKEDTSFEINIVESEPLDD